MSEAQQTAEATTTATATTTANNTDWKELGNNYFKNGKWGLAIKNYTNGIKEDPTNHFLYSNRAAAFMKMNKDHKALEDAEMCIKLQPEWAKGYYRKGCALKELLQHEAALEALEKAVELAPKDPEIFRLMKEVRDRVRADRRK